MGWLQRPPFTLDDFKAQMDQINRLGPMGKLIGMLPGISELAKQSGMGGGDVEKQMVRMRAMYDSMSKKERARPELLNGSRRRRIADGACVRVQEVIQFVRQFEMTREMMRRVRGG